jgi:hypothetical protein
LIRIAFIKFGGLAAGGTEKYIQNIAMGLDSNIFDATFFYCDAAKYLGSNFRHPDTDEDRRSLMLKSNVKLAKFRVAYKNVLLPSHPWLFTNFFKVFNENNFDLVFSARAGHVEFPFNKIRNVPIIDSIHLNAGVHLQDNIKAVLHLSKENLQKWVSSGGDKDIAYLVSHPTQPSPNLTSNLRKSLGLQNHLVYGFHQRNDDAIFSEIPLRAFSMLNNPKSHFLVLGGSIKYREQASLLGISNITFIDHSGSSKNIYEFLNSLDVYAHGSRDGEINSTAIAEALGVGLPVVTHSTKFNNGQIEIIEKCGLVASDLGNYVDHLELLSDVNHRLYFKAKSLEVFNNLYEFNGQIKRHENIFLNVLGL